MSGQALDPVITGHPHWQSFDDEEAKTNRLLVKAQTRAATEAAARSEHERKLKAWQADRDEADLEDREPNPAIKYPGEYVAPEPLFARRNPIEVVHERIDTLEAARRSWAKRMAPQLVPLLLDRDAERVSSLRAQLDELTATVAELELARSSLEWISACGGEAPGAPNLYEVREVLSHFSRALNRLGFASQAPPARTDGFVRLPMNLDGITVE